MIRYLALIFLLPAILSSAAAETRQAIHPPCSDTLVGHTVTLRKRINHSAVCYLNDPPGTYFFYEDGRFYLYRMNQSVEVVSVSNIGPSGSYGSSRERRKQKKSGDSTVLAITYYNELLGKQQLFLSSESKQLLTPGQLESFTRAAFVPEGQQDNFCYYAVHRKSGLIHSALCNHVSRRSDYDFLPNLPDSVEHEFCSVCFREKPWEVVAGVENYLGRTARNYYLSLNYEIHDVRTVQHIDSVAKSVLEEWPFPLRGLDYRFVIVENSQPNALACPDGTIILHNGLLDALDDEFELKAVLAHEIAHVELRHGVRQYLSSQKAALWSSMVGTLTGIVVAHTTDDVDAAILSQETSSSIVNVFAEIALNGYSRKYETEADRTAELYLRCLHGESATDYMSQIIRKLSYYDNCVPASRDRSSGSTHPTADQRLLALEQNSIDILDPPVVFEAFDEHGHLIATFSILARDQVTCYAVLETTVYLREPCEVKDFSFTNLRSKCDNEADTQIYPGQKSFMVFHGPLSRGFEKLTSMEFELSLNNVKEWRRLPRP